MILVALLTITAPTAFADSFSITFTEGATTPADTAQLTFQLQLPTGGALDLGTVTDGSDSFTFSTPLLTSNQPQKDSYTWFLFLTALSITDGSTGNSQEVFTTGPQIFTTQDSGIAIVSSTSSAVPEPSTVVLTLIGMGLLVVMRKRKALGLAQAT